MLYRFDVFDLNALGLFEDCEKSLKRFGETELFAKVQSHPSPPGCDGCLTITAPNGSSSIYICEAKNRIDNESAGRVINLLQRRAAESGMKPLLIANHINDALGARLRDAGLSYLDTSGNACLTTDPLLYIWVQGFKPTEQPERVSRAFQSSGLQLIAFLLSRPDALAQSYRELAEQAGLSLGSTSRILSDLRGLGFIRLIGPRHDVLANAPSLLEHWEFGYDTRLRPRLKPQTFRQAEKLPVDVLPERIPTPMREDILIGGELAASIATGNLRPQSVTFHLRQHRLLSPFLQELRLIPDRTGNIVILEQFGEMSAWRWEKYKKDRLVNQLLVYAELLHGKSDDRLRETAKIILERYLTPLLHDQPSIDNR